MNVGSFKSVSPYCPWVTEMIEVLLGLVICLQVLIVFILRRVWGELYGAIKESRTNQSKHCEHIGTEIQDSTDSVLAHIAMCEMNVAEGDESIRNRISGVSVQVEKVHKDIDERIDKVDKNVGIHIESVKAAREQMNKLVGGLK